MQTCCHQKYTHQFISDLKPDLPYIYLNISHADYLGRQHRIAVCIVVHFENVLSL